MLQLLVAIVFVITKGAELFLQALNSMIQKSFER